MRTAKVRHQPASSRAIAAYRHHDEHNADVREDIELKARSLVDALGEWLGTDKAGQLGW